MSATKVILKKSYTNNTGKTFEAGRELLVDKIKARELLLSGYIEPFEPFNEGQAVMPTGDRRKFKRKSK